VKLGMNQERSCKASKDVKDASWLELLKEASKGGILRSMRAFVILERVRISIN
jgi:hypothetical protein